MPPTSLHTRAIGTLAPALLLLCTSCCNLATYFCGPDRTDWAPISYRTHPEALQTFQEAVRRDNVRVICESLAPELKARWRLPGCFEAAVAWQRVKEQAPGAHMLGRADITGPEQLSGTRVRYRLEVGSVAVNVELVRLAYAGVHYDHDGEQEPRERYLESNSINDLVRVSRQGLDSTVQLHINEVELPDNANITRVIAAYEWKVADLRQAVEH